MDDKLNKSEIIVILGLSLLSIPLIGFIILMLFAVIVGSL